MHYPVSLSDCAFCPRECHADRTRGPMGWCRLDDSFSISTVCIHRGEEPVISGSLGICNIFFSHCNLQCIYCQNYQISDNRRVENEDRMELDQVVRQVAAILDRGIRLVGFVSPSHCIPQMLAIMDGVNKAGYYPKWVYNSNGYDKVETLKMLEGRIDIYLPDLKYMDGAIAQRYSRAENYPEVAAAALKEMYRQKGPVLHLDEEGVAESGIIIRHLVLPQHIENSLSVLEFIARELSPKIHLSLMSQYHPTPGVSAHPALSAVLTPGEYDRVRQKMEEEGLFNGWVQELESASFYLPDFGQDHPFEPEG